MGLVRLWTRQVARAAGASLIAPLVLLLTAGLVASGGGLGGLGSLGQIASGPSLPDTGLQGASRSSIEGAEIVGADVSASRRPANPSVPARTELASAEPPAAEAPAPAATAGRRTEADVSPPAQRPLEPTPRPRPEEGTLLNDTPQGAPPPPSSVDELQETTRGLGESISEPLQPVGNQLLDLLHLLVPPPR